MTVDLPGLRSELRHLESRVAELRRIVHAAEQQEIAATGQADPGVPLPPEIVVPRPGAVADYLRARPDLAQIVAEMARALLQEFANEPSQIELDVYQDPEIDDRYLVYYVRLPEYDEGFVDRLERVSAQFDGRSGTVDDWVLVTTDYHPMS